QKHPHAELRHLALLAEVGDLRGRRRVMHFAAAPPAHNNRGRGSRWGSSKNYARAEETPSAIRARSHAKGCPAPGAQRTGTSPDRTSATHTRAPAPPPRRTTEHSRPEIRADTHDTCAASRARLE